MKKFVIMTLVLCLASYASAGLSWTVTGGTGSGGAINPGDALTLSLDESGSSVTSMVIDLMTDNDALNGTFTGSAVHGGFDVIAVPGWSTGVSVPALDAFLTGASYPATGQNLDDWAWIDVGWSGAGTAPTGAGILTLNYTAGAVGSYTVAGGLIGAPLQGKDAITELTGIVTMPTLGITVVPVPEPMTMVLLGIGGLFLRRRK